ncbi:MAG: L-histidine Nalpha-methyltransferase [Acidobacteriota bacterium]|jgi:dimethylhistidine N-methyltransferase|nr:L-histidine Nalpha-methyltransferase [Acidobacteriota bacterium]
MPNDFADDVRHGLTAERRFLLPQYFYDALGSALFTAICELPEYYVTRAETEILNAHAAEIAEAFQPPVRLVELGAGSGRKTRILIEALLERQPELEYAPLDIDPHILELSARELTNTYERLRVTPLVGDFHDPREALVSSADRTVVLFLGSTIGNLDPDEAASLLTNVRGALRSGDALFLGADLRKPLDVLIPAYDDPLGVTAAFNKNVLARINRELGANFDLSQFAHRAIYDEQLGRIEMHLVSLAAQRVHIDALDLDVDFAEGETIHTENSHKYDEAALRSLAARGGFDVTKIWKDSRGWFADLLLTVP